MQGEHQEEQKLQAEALQDQDAVSPVEPGLKYQRTFVLCSSQACILVALGIPGDPWGAPYAEAAAAQR